ncbi:MAG: FAD-dependent oxidoreductase [Phycicoccus sp.]
MGAGIWLQPLGQRVLDELELLAPLRAVSAAVSRVRVETRSGRSVASLDYGALPDAEPALGVHRGALFGILHDAVRSSGIPIRLGERVTDVRPGGSGVAVSTTHDESADYRLVIGADGARSSVRGALKVTRRDRAYRYGALWAVVDDPDRLAAGELYQCLGGTRRYLGVLPTGTDQASVFWSVRTPGLPPDPSSGLDAWRREARPYAREYGPLLDLVTELLPAVYRDVVVTTPFRTDGCSGAVLVGDAAHATSPQLGTGTSLALADAWSLARQLRRHHDLGDALAAYAADRRAHWRWYQWCTRALMPLFQSDLDVLTAPRDLLGGPLSRLPGVEPALMRTFLGDRVSLRRRWTPT